MAYYIAKTLDLSFEDAVQRVVQELKGEGFGVLTEIDVKATLAKKLGVQFRDYKILGACNAPLAHRALQAERMIGTMLPCNVIVQDAGQGKTEVAAVDPAASMQAVENQQLAELAGEVRSKLQRVMERLG